MFITIVDGDWGSWGNWSNCTATCGGGESSRFRLCDDPLPQHGGDYCPRNDTSVERLLSNGTIQQEETTSCNVHHCPGK